MLLRAIFFSACLCCSFSLKAQWETLAFQLGQKQMLDIRYFCEDSTPENPCRTPVTQLTPELAEMLVRHQIGGVILFAENIQSVEQTQTLIQALQTTVKKAGLPPLFIAIDQEGGRVSRIPVSASNAFAGNMAIGATYEKHKTHYAKAVNSAIAEQLKALGVNTNFAPTVDVNVNPENPVINVRSYGESSKAVAELGLASVKALQSNGVIAAMKHFPGHGDTHVDSHTGLPLVEHAREIINDVDLRPFRHAIELGEGAQPEMIMTAHIQYPALDKRTFKTLDGSDTILPATLSKSILTDLLRNEMGYQGVVVTDALDMAGIAHYMSSEDALLQTFYAGADIALMPFTIRDPMDIAAYDQLMASVQRQIKAGKADKQSRGIGMVTASQLDASAQRIAKLKKRYALASSIDKSNNAMPRFDALEKALAVNAITPVITKVALPIPNNSILMLMPDNARCLAMKNAMLAQQYREVDCISLANRLDMAQLEKQLASAATIIVGDISPQHSMAEMGGMDDLVEWQNRTNKAQQFAIIKHTLAQAKAQQKLTVFVALRAPYVISQFSDDVDIALVTYDYRIYQDPDGQARGVMFDALANVLSGKVTARGNLPVTVTLN
ncbi:glycoside hydrolase family 3 N-terminal domain-containing protein [Alteromonas facilis]|uniref:glycoside hydrolase family 3 N-terminal domain-containing protein n=1 Tax=Alteromonas facilis TaxID=2048004 RepID=UPI000C28C191|nr:glycoside hydrolase family 3 protein [Alteromonas facilis]